jgi:hypothetical protein
MNCIRVGEDKCGTPRRKHLPGEKKRGVSAVNTLFLLITTAVPSVSVGLHNLFRNNSVMCVLLKTTVVYKFSVARGKLR